MILCQLVLLSHLMVTCVSISFVSTPGLMRHKTGENALFSWTLDTKPKAFGEIIITYDSITMVKLLADGSVTSDPKYRGRVSLTASDKTITLTLKAINRDDVIHGTYSLIGTFLTGNYFETIADNSASIYLFGKPTKPVISGATDTKEGEDLILSCTSSGTSVPAQYQLPLRYTWKRNSINLTMSLPERHRITNNQLVITGLIRDDRSHQYSCIAKEDGGLASESDGLVLPVLYPPGHASVFISNTEPLIERENPAVDITCSVDDPGYPQARFRWSKDGQIQSGGESGTINIRQRSASVSKHDGTWKCAPNNSEGDGTSAIISVIVNAKASLSPALPKTLTVVADPKDSFNVTCGFTSKPSATISWTYNDGVLPPGVSTQSITTTSSGKKSNVTQKLLWNPDSDASSRRSAGGRYLCSGSVDLGKGRQDTKQSQMLLKVEYAPYEITFNSSDTLTVVAGVDRIAVACNAICKPSCGYQWQKTDGNDMRNSTTLILSPVHKVDHGSYVCLASNKHNMGGIRKVFTLNVNFAPQIISFLPSTSSEIIQDNRLTIRCEVSSRPKSTITITSNVTSDIILSVSDSDKALYTFDSVHVLDSGVYHCTASNGIKPETKVTKQLILDVKGGYRVCETPVTEEGKALNATLTLSVCLSANPFSDVTSSDWTFRPTEQQMSQNLPDDIAVSVRDTSHPYKKYVTLVIDKVTESRYGTYRLKIKNRYNDKELECVFRLLSEEASAKGLPVTVIVEGVLGVLVTTAVVIIMILWRKGLLPKVVINKSAKRRQNKEQSTEIDSYQTMSMSPTKHSQISSVYQLLAEPTLTVFQNSDIILQSVINSGDFYDIWNGQLKNKENLPLDVVIKANKTLNNTYKVYLKEQGVAMVKLRSNDYTIACFGISEDNKYLLMEKVCSGNLQVFLREQSESSYYNIAKDEDLPKLMNFLHQIIRGVKSIFQLQPPTIFYCLSASNILITNQQQCKLTGFATSTAVTERENWEEKHKLPRPVRWLSPEAIKLNHTKESDIWSLGIVIWEITSKGQKPLANENDKEAKELILRGFRLLKPVNCPDELFDLMSSCWIYQPKKRPSIDDIESQFLEITQYEAL